VTTKNSQQLSQYSKAVLTRGTPVRSGRNRAVHLAKRPLHGLNGHSTETLRQRRCSLMRIPLSKKKDGSLSVEGLLDGGRS
jgi:hypothetical protein